MITLMILFGGQVALGSICGWELGKKANYKRLGEKSRFAPKDLVRTHKKWSDFN